MSDLPPPAPGRLGVTMLLAEAAQVADGKLYLLGGGLSVISPRPKPLAIALLIEVPWDRANISHSWRLDLIGEGDVAIMSGDRPIAVGGRFEAGRPTGLRPGTPLTVPLAIGFPSIPVEAEHNYRWQLTIDGRSELGWRVGFHVGKA